MLEQNLAKTMLEFQELMTVFQVMMMVILMIMIMIVMVVLAMVTTNMTLISAASLEWQPKSNEGATMQSAGGERRTN